MTWGNGPMVSAPFLGYITAVLFAAAILIPFGYLIGSKVSRRAGFVWLAAVVALALLVTGGLLAWAASSGQLAAFVNAFGVDPLIEIGVFILLIWIITGFPTVRGVLDMER